MGVFKALHMLYVHARRLHGLIATESHMTEKVGMVLKSEKSHYVYAMDQLNLVLKNPRAEHAAVVQRVNICNYVRGQRG